jgi:hypothetical protein
MYKQFALWMVRVEREHNLYRGVGTMRYLWLAFFIGWSSSAYAAMGTSPSVDVPITISPSGPTPPPGAVAAGFTTLAANYDFTQPLPANWLGCAPFDGNTHQWYQGLWWYSSEPPCNITQVGDSVAASNVLDLQWLPSYAGQGTQDYLVMSTLSHDTTKVTDFPNAYYEIVYRVAPTVPDPNSSPLTAFWTWGTDSARGGSGPIEWDFIETYGSNFGAYDAGIHNHGNSDLGTQFVFQGTSSFPAGYDPTQYHTYAMRITSDGSTQMSACSYVDGTLIACANPQAVRAEFNQRNFIIVWNGAGGQPVTQKTDMYVKSVRVWSCANWKTTMCNGTVLTAAP